MGREAHRSPPSPRLRASPCRALLTKKPAHPTPALQIFGAFYKNKNMAPGSVTCAWLSHLRPAALIPNFPPSHPPLDPCAPFLPPLAPFRCSRRCLAVLREGKKIEDTDTPESLEMDEGEVVDAQLQQTGGC